MAEGTADNGKTKIKYDRFSLRLRHLEVQGISITTDGKCFAEKQRMLRELCKTWKRTCEVLAFSVFFLELIPRI